MFNKHLLQLTFFNSQSKVCLGILQNFVIYCKSCCDFTFLLENDMDQHIISWIKVADLAKKNSLKGNAHSAFSVMQNNKKYCHQFEVNELYSDFTEFIKSIEEIY